MSRYTYLFDAGHGGMINGVYQTDPKIWKRAYFKNGTLLSPNEHNEKWLESNCDLKYYEGVGNRDIAKRIMKLCADNKISYYDVVNSESDVALEKRVGNANSYHSKYKNCIYISIHGNAFDKESAQGFSVYTTPGFTNSDLVATILFKEIALEFPDHKPRPDNTDGDPDSEANFYVLKHTSMPAVLSETLFYTNYKECQIMASEEGRQRIANAHFKAIQHLEKYGI